MNSGKTVCNLIFFTGSFLFFLLLIIFSCEKLELTRITKVTTGSATGIKQTSCSAQGSVIEISEEGITQHGHCWSTAVNPTINNSKTQLGSRTSTGSFTSNLTGLSANTTYCIRAYAIDDEKTAYGNKVSFTTLSATVPSAVTDIDGNTYNVVQIGSQVWMKENLKTTRYKDGTDIPLVTDNTAWSNLTTPGYCWYNNDAGTYKVTYGALYNWYTVNTGKLCPTGWHVPTDDEWTTLTTYLGGESVAGGKLKETGTMHWTSPNTGATNESGFTALPGGYRVDNGAFYGIGSYGYWWSATEDVAPIAWYRSVLYSTSYVGRNTYYKSFGFSVRCLRD